jgi:uncharacterized protein (DUF2164 family)
MLIGMILGAVIGTILLAALAYWYTKQQIKIQEVLDNDLETATIIESLLLDLPIEKKLRNALFETERGEAKCVEEINKIIELQTDLLDGIGKPSFVLLKDKGAFFILEHPISGTKKYYYNRDLTEGLESSMLSETQKLLLYYNEHIDILMSKYELYKRLSVSHRENINKIDGIQKQHEQLQKIKKHKKNISELEGRTDIEVNALKNEYILEDIERELDFKNQCLKEISQLYEKMDSIFDHKAGGDYKTEIKNLIKKIEDDPEKMD